MEFEFSSCHLSVKYLAIIDNEKNTGLLIGAGTFPLAKGKLASNGQTNVVFANSYSQ